MRVSRPKGLSAGFHADLPEAATPELLFCGEYWALPEWSIGQHAHAAWEFYYQIDGTSEWAGQRRVYRLAAGDFFAVGPGMVHRMVEAPRSAHHFFYAAMNLDVVLARHAGLRDAWAARGRSIVHLRDAGAVEAPFRQLVREVTLVLAHRADGIRLALDTLVVEATRLLEQPRPPQSLLRAHPAVVRAKGLMDQQPQRAWTLTELARETGLSATHLAGLFKAEVGMPPRQYLLRLRVQRAKQYLAESRPSITEIAIELGFSSSQHFAAVFKELAGVTPRDYRAGQRGSGDRSESL